MILRILQTEKETEKRVKITIHQVGVITGSAPLLVSLQSLGNFLIHVTFTLLQGQTTSCSLHKMIKYFKQLTPVPPWPPETDAVIAFVKATFHLHLSFLLRVYELSIAASECRITDVLWAVLDALSWAFNQCIFLHTSLIRCSLV